MSLDRPLLPRLAPAAVLAVLVLVPLVPLAAPRAAEAQPPDADTSPPVTDAPAAPASETVSQGPRRLGDPYAAYEAGAYDEALAAFVDRQIERPEDPELALNLGATYYQMRDYAAADRAFSEAAAAGDDAVRAEALYNLGNSAYRQGKLEEAVVRYQASLDLTPSDVDAKFNLEFVRDEIRRRHEEAQKRQEQQDQQGDQQQEQQEQQQEGEQQQDGESGSDQPQDDQQQGEGSEDGPQDSDRDGIPDEQERSADNPTDPENPDTDGDGLLDGEEDKNANGRQDPDETDPNREDSDGDGISDGQEAAEQNQAASQGEAGGATPEAGREMTREEAERFLAALEEGRADPDHKARKGRRTRPEKDW